MKKVLKVLGIIVLALVVALAAFFAYAQYKNWKTLNTPILPFMKLCLADALIKLMAAQDYDSINVNTICELAGVGRTTFYRHLDCKNSKEELLI